MLEKECSELLGVKANWNANTPDSEITLKNLTYAIERSLESRLVGPLVKIKGFTAVQILNDDSMLLLKSGDKLMLLEIAGYEDKYFDASTHGQTLFHALDNEGLLHEVLPQPIVDEYKRLSDILMSDRIARSEENDRKRNQEQLEKLLKMRSAGLI